MRNVASGDVIFSFCDTKIKALGVAVGVAQSALKPDLGSAGNQWGNEGWLVPVEFQEFSFPVRPKDHINQLRSYLPSKYSPLQVNGDGLQSVYLAEVPEPMSKALKLIIGQEYQDTLNSLVSNSVRVEDEEDKAEDQLKDRTDIGPTTREQLVKSRRGQGVFKANVRLNEHGCRVTGTSELKHLRASHIKPWKDSSDDEKLNGCNGLLLAPHIDHLFDQGYITFEDSGALKISSAVESSLLSEWGLPAIHNAGYFSPAQCNFLAYHRSNIFKK